MPTQQGRSMDRDRELGARLVLGRDKVEQELLKEELLRESVSL